jgi:hypothetical protein
MDIASIPVGDNPPHEINVIIEIPQGGVPVKYEVDKKSGAMFVDRFPAYRHVLSGELRLHPAHAVRGRRSGRLPRRRADAGRARRRPRAADPRC